MEYTFCSIGKSVILKKEIIGSSNKWYGFHGGDIEKSVVVCNSVLFSDYVSGNG